MDLICAFQQESSPPLEKRSDSRLRRRARLANLSGSILLGSLAFAVNAPSVASDGFTYTKVADFSALPGVEAICDFAMNDNGDVAYVGQQPTTVAGVAGTLYQVHLWNPTGANQIVYSATVLTTAQGVITYSPPGTPYCGGFGGGSVGMAINNNRLIAIEATIPDQSGLFLGYGELFIDPTTSPATATAVQMPYVANSGPGLNSSGALGILTFVNPNRVLGSVSPAGVSALQSFATGISFSWNSPAGIQYGQPAINDSGLVSVLAQDSATTLFSLVDLTAAGAVSETLVVPNPGSDPTGRIGIDAQGDVAFVTSIASHTVGTVSLVKADRTAVLNFTDSSKNPGAFPYSTPAYPVSLTNGWQITLATEDNGPPGGGYSLWAVAADGIPVDIFSGLDPTFPVTDPMTGVTTNVGCTTGCNGNQESVINGGATPPSLDMMTNRAGTTIFYVSDSAAGHLVIASPKPGFLVSAPVAPSSVDPVSSAMTFAHPCYTVGTPGQFLNSATLVPGAYTGYCYLDPPVATGYTLTAAPGASPFQSVIIPMPLPGGQSAFTITYPNPVTGSPPISAPINAASTFTFPAGGVATFTISGINASEALQVTNTTAFELGLTWVNPLTQPTDLTMLPLSDSGPTLTPTITGLLGTSGWYRGDVTVSWSVTDAAAAILSETGCTTSVVATDTAGQSFTCSASSAGGSTSQTVTVKRDATPPIATAGATPPPNANGWNDGPVTVSFTGIDATSGISSCSAAAVMSAEGAAQISPSGTCLDGAGNLSAAATATVNIDRTPPTVTLGTPANGASYVQGTPVTASFTCADGLSGVASCVGSLPSGSAVSTATAGIFSFLVTATDNAGNAATATSTYTVTGAVTGGGPTIVPTVSGTLGQNGWYVSNVTVSFAVTPAGAETEGCAARTITQNTAGTVLTCKAKSSKGSASQSVTIKRDASPPTLSFSESPGPDSFGWQHAPVTVNVACSSVSGIASCPAPVTLTVQGAGQTVAGTAVNNAGLSATGTSPGINLDLTAPTVAVTTPANGAVYMLNSGVSAGYACSDALSGIAQCSGTVANGAAINTTQRVNNRPFTVTGRDKAGNSTQVTTYYSVR